MHVPYPDAQDPHSYEWHANYVYLQEQKDVEWSKAVMLVVLIVVAIGGFAFWAVHPVTPGDPDRAPVATSTPK